MESQFHTTGSQVWVWANNEQGWLKGTVQKVVEDGKLQVVQDDGKVKTYKPEDCPLRNVDSRMGVEVRNLSRCADFPGPMELPWEGLVHGHRGHKHLVTASARAL